MDTKIRYDNVIAGNIRRLRIIRGLKQKEVITKLQLAGIDMTRDKYVKLERGHRNISRIELLMIIEILDTTLENILTRDEEDGIID